MRSPIEARAPPVSGGNQIIVLTGMRATGPSWALISYGRLDNRYSHYLQQH